MLDVHLGLKAYVAGMSAMGGLQTFVRLASSAAWEEECVMAESLEVVFSELRNRMMRASKGMNVVQDEPGNVVMKTSWNEPGKKEPAWFGAVQLKKNYVSCHLMPLYSLPPLRERLSPDLQKRLQGKSCFNFKKVEPELFDALEQLTAECAAAYAEPVTANPH